MKSAKLLLRSLLISISFVSSVLAMSVFQDDKKDTQLQKAIEHTWIVSHVTSKETNCVDYLPKDMIGNVSITFNDQQVYGKGPVNSFLKSKPYVLTDEEDSNKKILMIVSPLAPTYFATTKMGGPGLCVEDLWFEFLRQTHHVTFHKDKMIVSPLESGTTIEQIEFKKSMTVKTDLR